MSKKDYIAIAEIIRTTPEFEIASALADYFEAENPHFNRARFLAACAS